MANALSEQISDWESGTSGPFADARPGRVAITARRDKVGNCVVASIPVDVVYRQVSLIGTSSTVRPPRHLVSTPVTAMGPRPDMVVKSSAVPEYASIRSRNWMRRISYDTTRCRLVGPPVLSSALGRTIRRIDPAGHARRRHCPRERLTTMRTVFRDSFPKQRPTHASEYISEVDILEGDYYR